MKDGYNRFRDYVQSTDAYRNFATPEERERIDAWLAETVKPHCVAYCNRESAAIKPTLSEDIVRHYFVSTRMAQA